MASSLLAVAGCAPQPQRDLATEDCGVLRTFFVVNYGWHTGLVVSRADLGGMIEPLAPDFDHGDYLEIGWGDRLFYQSGDLNIGLMLRAALWPTETVMHVVGIPIEPRRYFVAGDLYAVDVPESGYRDLLAFVAAGFKRSSEGTLEKLGPALYGAGWFYRAEGRFHLGNTCNTWVAKAIAATGYPFADPGTLSAGGVVSQLSRGIGAPGCYGVHSADQDDTVGAGSNQRQ